MPGDAAQDGRLDTDLRRVGAEPLDGGEEVPRQEVVEGAPHIDIAVQVDASVAVESPEPDVVGRRGPLAHGYGFPHEGDRVDVEGLPVPEFDFVIGEDPLPGAQAAADQSGVGVASEPAEVDDFRYHGFKYRNFMGKSIYL